MGSAKIPIAYSVILTRPTHEGIYETSKYCSILMKVGMGPTVVHYDNTIRHGEIKKTKKNIFVTHILFIIFKIKALQIL